MPVGAPSLEKLEDVLYLRLRDGPLHGLPGKRLGKARVLSLPIGGAGGRRSTGCPIPALRKRQLLARQDELGASGARDHMEGRSCRR